MKKISLIINLSFLIFLCYSCGESSDNSSMIPTVEQSKTKKIESNAITQSMPSLMVIPSDAMLKRMNCLSEEVKQGVVRYKRDYSNSFIKDSELKFVIAEIESQFSKFGFNMENMEQSLKLITNNNAMDNMEGVARDLRAELMNTARPDYIVELDYELKQDPKSRNPKKTLTYIVECLDVYTSKAISTLTRANVGKDSENNDVPSLVKEDFSTSIVELRNGITDHFKDILANGSEITLRVAVLNTSSVSLEDDCGDEEISEKIISWMKENTINSTYKMVKNTSTEILFTSVRIYTQDENSNSYTAYDFAKELRKGLKRGCGLTIKNKTQSIGDAFLQIN